MRGCICRLPFQAWARPACCCYGQRSTEAFPRPMQSGRTIPASMIMGVFYYLLISMLPPVAAVVATMFLPVVSVVLLRLTRRMERGDVAEEAFGACRSGIGRVFLRCPRRAAGASEERGPLRGARAFRRLHGGVLLGAWVHARPHVGAAVRFGWRDRRGDVRRRCDSDGCGGRCERGFAWRGQDRPGLQACGSPSWPQDCCFFRFWAQDRKPLRRGHHVGLHPCSRCTCGLRSSTGLRT